MSELDPRIHQVLDGELPLESLPPELQATVLRLERAAGLLRAAEAPAGVSTRVLAVLRRPLPGGSRRRGLLRWLTERHAVTIAMRPVWSLALAAALAAVVLVPTHGTGPLLGAQEGIAQFVGHFPGARAPAWRAGSRRRRSPPWTRWCGLRRPTTSPLSPWSRRPSRARPSTRRPGGSSKRWRRTPTSCVRRARSWSAPAVRRRPPPRSRPSPRRWCAGCRRRSPSAS